MRRPRIPSLVGSFDPARLSRRLSRSLVNGMPGARSRAQLTSRARRAHRETGTPPESRKWHCKHVANAMRITDRVAEDACEWNFEKFIPDHCEKLFLLIINDDEK